MSNLQSSRRGYNFPKITKQKVIFFFLLKRFTKKKTELDRLYYLPGYISQRRVRFRGTTRVQVYTYYYVLLVYTRAQKKKTV